MVSTERAPLPTNLPVQVTSFVGRRYEIGELARLLGRTRILTLTGAGGVGKTRLALQTAGTVLEHYPDGVWLVELASISDPSLVTRETAASLGVQEQRGRPMIDALVDDLRPTRTLLLLDNCEHLIGACADLADALVRACPEVQILATSREPLGIDGETDWRVPSLAVPDPSRLPPLDRLARYEGVQLFVERAMAAVPSFLLTDEEAAPVARICERLDGIPLAIELAAARMKALSASQIAGRLDDLFRLLTVGSRTALPRQQTLRATLDWSYDLLSETERRLFARLSVFAGGWTLEAAEAVCGGWKDEEPAPAPNAQSPTPSDVLDLLAHLVDKSLVVAERTGGEVRYRLLEPMRQYAAEKLQAFGDELVLRTRHLAWFRTFATRADDSLRGPGIGVWLDRLETEHDNLRAALDWRSPDPSGADAALELGGALAWFWWLREYLPEGRERLTRALARPSPSPAARMRALAGAAWLAHFHRNPAAALAHGEESLSIARKLGDSRAVAWALHLLGRVHYFDGDAAAARALAEESLVVARQVGDPWLVAWPIHLLGLAAHVEGDYVEAMARYGESLSIRRAIGDEGNALVLGQLLGLAAHRAGDHAKALAHYAQSLQRTSDLGLRYHVYNILAEISALAADHDQPERAVWLAAAASRRSEVVGVLPIPLIQEVLDEGLERARRSLGPETFAAAWARGAAMPQDTAIGEALALVDSLAGPPGPSQPPAIDGPSVGEAASSPKGSPSLSPREVEVLRLMAVGRTSKEIAAELVIAVPTVDRHITHIYAKIGARRRTDATAYALKHRLI